MKKTLILLIIICSFYKSTFGQSQGIEINGKIQGLSSPTPIYFTNVKDTLAESKIINGSFDFKFNTKLEDGFYFIWIGDKSREVNVKERRYLTMFLSNKDEKVAVNGNITTWPQVDVSGSYENSICQNFNLKDVIFKIKMDSIRTKAKENGNPMLTTDLENMVNEELKFRKNFILQNPDSKYVAYLILKTNSIDYKQKLLSYENLNEKIKLSKFGLQLKKHLDQLAQRGQTIIGNEAPNFFSNTIDGKKVSLKSVVKENKLTLIDFWASWCKPCRAQIPEIKRTFEAFHKYGFNIIGVSFDWDRDSWVKAIRDEKMPWLQVSQLKGRNEEASLLYDINAIPAYMLIDQDGKIVEIDFPGSKIPSNEGSLHGENLYKKVEEVLRKKNIDRKEVKMK